MFLGQDIKQTIMENKSITLLASTSFKTKFPGATLVLAGDRGNNFRNLDDGVIYRHTAPFVGGRELLKFLKR
jgi:hypothetical protein